MNKTLWFKTKFVQYVTFHHCYSWTFCDVVALLFYLPNVFKIPMGKKQREAINSAFWAWTLGIHEWMAFFTLGAQIFTYINSPDSSPYSSLETKLRESLMKASLKHFTFDACLFIFYVFYWCLLIFFAFFTFKWGGKSIKLRVKYTFWNKRISIKARKSQEAMKAYRWDSLFTFDLVLTIVILKQIKNSIW